MFKVKEKKKKKKKKIHIPASLQHLLSRESTFPVCLWMLFSVCDVQLTKGFSAVT